MAPSPNRGHQNERGQVHVPIHELEHWTSCISHPLKLFSDLSNFQNKNDITPNCRMSRIKCMHQGVPLLTVEFVWTVDLFIQKWYPYLGARGVASLTLAVAGGPTLGCPWTVAVNGINFFKFQTTHFLPRFESCINLLVRFMNSQSFTKVCHRVFQCVCVCHGGECFFAEFKLSGIAQNIYLIRNNCYSLSNGS